MATTVHLPLTEIDLALKRAQAGESVMLDGNGVTLRLERVDSPLPRAWSFDELGPIHIERTDFRPLSVILADPDKVWSDVVMDDQWGRDMDEVLAYNRANDRDPWAE